jgi:hypothetical protein
MKAVSLRALLNIIERHKLEPVNGEFHFTDEMIAEAAAIDEANGDLTPEKLEELQAAIEGRHDKWREADPDELLSFFGDGKERLNERR